MVLEGGRRYNFAYQLKVAGISFVQSKIWGGGGPFSSLMVYRSGVTKFRFVCFIDHIENFSYVHDIMTF